MRNFRRTSIHQVTVERSTFLIDPPDTTIIKPIRQTCNTITQNSLSLTSFPNTQPWICLNQEKINEILQLLKKGAPCSINGALIVQRFSLNVCLIFEATIKIVLASLPDDILSKPLNGQIVPSLYSHRIYTLASKCCAHMQCPETFERRLQRFQSCGLDQFKPAYELASTIEVDQGTLGSTVFHLLHRFLNEDLQSEDISTLQNLTQTELMPLLTEMLQFCADLLAHRTSIS